MIRNFFKKTAKWVGITSTIFAFCAVNAQAATLIQWNIPSLAAGDDATLTINTTVDPGTAIEYPVDHEVSNTATIESVDQTDSNNANDSSTQDVTIIDDIDFELSKTAAGLIAGDEVAVGQTINYTITLDRAPDGVIVVDSFVLTDIIPGELENITAPVVSPTSLNPGLSLTGNNLELTFEDLANGYNFDTEGTISITFSADVKADAACMPINNTASVVLGTNSSLETVDLNTNGDNDQGVFNLMASCDADLSIIKSTNAVDFDTDTIPDTTEGSTVQYTLTIENEGGALVTDINGILDTFNATYMDYVVGSAVLTSSVGGALTQPTVNASPLSFDVNGLTMNNGDIITITYDMTVKTGSAGNIALNTGSVDAATIMNGSTTLDDPTSTGNNTSDVSVDIKDIDLDITKQLPTGAPSEYDEGDTVTYEIIVDNTSAVGSATNLVVEDTLPDGLEVPTCAALTAGLAGAPVGTTVAIDTSGDGVIQPGEICP